MEHMAKERARDIQYDTPSWQAGYDAGLAGKLEVPPDHIDDDLAWLAGYVEGKADRQHGIRHQPDAGNWVGNEDD